MFKFEKAKTEVDFSKLTSGQSLTATVTSFSYSNEHCIARIEDEDSFINAYVGKISMNDMMNIKGTERTVIYQGTKDSKGKTYPQFKVQF